MGINIITSYRIEWTKLLSDTPDDNGVQYATTMEETFDNVEEGRARFNQIAELVPAPLTVQLFKTEHPDKSVSNEELESWKNPAHFPDETPISDLIMPGEAL